jgi:hypothetical protein
LLRPDRIDRAMRNLAHVPIRWNHLIDKNMRQIKSLSMILSQKWFHFCGSCSSAARRAGPLSRLRGSTACQAAELLMAAGRCRKVDPAVLARFPVPPCGFPFAPNLQHRAARASSASWRGIVRPDLVNLAAVRARAKASPAASRMRVPDRRHCRHRRAERNGREGHVSSCWLSG